MGVASAYTGTVLPPKRCHVRHPFLPRNSAILDC